MIRYIQLGLTILLPCIVIAIQYFMRKDAKLIKKNIPKVEHIASEVIKGINEASKIDNLIFPNSKSSEVLQSISNLIQNELSKIDMKTLSSENGQVEICKILKDSLEDHIGRNEIIKPVG